MVKPGLGLFTGRRKSSSNVLEDMVDSAPSPDGSHAANADSGGFRLMSRTEVEKATERRKTMEREKSSSKFRFSGFGGNGKGRVQSFEEDSPGSSKRDSKSSSGTQFSSRPYNNGQHGSTSTLPSSTDTSSDDNLFSSAPRPPIPQHNSSPSSSLSMNGFRKQLPSLPKSSHGVSSKKAEKQGRERSMTTSSYASTAIAPKLGEDLNFGNSDFEDMFSDMNRKESPPEIPREVVGRSLLSEKRTFQAEPIKIHPKLAVEAPLASWESRGSADNLMSPHSDDDSPPPPPPPHKYSSYAPVASESPTLPSHATFGDRDAHIVRQPFMDKKSYRDSSPEQQSTQPTSISSSSANSLQTPVSSRSSNYTNNTTPKASLASTVSAYTDNDDDGDNMFAPVKAELKPQSRAAQKAPAPYVAEDKTPTAPVRPGAGRVLTQTEYLAMQKRATSQPPPEDDSDDDYEDEEEAIRQREEEEIMRRKQKQMQFAREAMRRTTMTSANSARPEGGAEDFIGFPSETSIKADEWEDEDVPLGILAQHGFPSQARNRLPNQPANAMPSYIPDRPASAGALPNRGPPGHLPAFARGLPADPHTSFIGGGLVQPSNRESMGFNGFGRGPMSVAGDSIAGGMGMGMSSPMMYQDAGMSQPSLVDQIQMRDMTKQKYMGGASQKKPEGGPFTGMLGQQMNASGQSQQSTRMSQMPMMNGMMNPMMGGQMPMMGMGMNQMGYSVPQGNDMVAMHQMQQMQQMIAMQQMQLQQMQVMQRPQTQDPRMSMAMPSSNFGGNMMGNGSFLSVPGAMQNRPMSFMSGAHGPQPSMSNYMGPGPGYTPSIAPSERSNIGLSARYRPVVSNSDAHSTGTSTILQASSGATPNKPTTIKGIIKPARQTLVEEDEDWSKMAARKNRFISNKQPQSNGLEELTKGLNI